MNGTADRSKEAGEELGCVIVAEEFSASVRTELPAKVAGNVAAISEACPETRRFPPTSEGKP